MDECIGVVITEAFNRTPRACPIFATPVIFRNGGVIITCPRFRTTAIVTAAIVVSGLCIVIDCGWISATQNPTRAIVNGYIGIVIDGCWICAATAAGEVTILVA